MADITTNPTFTSILNEGIEIRRNLFNQIEKELGGKLISYVETKQESTPRSPKHLESISPKLDRACKSYLL